MDDNQIARIERIAALFKDGMLTQEEFNEEKQKILGANSIVDAATIAPKPDLEDQSERNVAGVTSNPSPGRTTVQSSLCDEPLDSTFGASSEFYSRKFNRIVSKADVGALDITDNLSTINAKIQRTLSFNIWGLLFGPLWGCYRRLPSAWIFIILIVVFNSLLVWSDFSSTDIDRMLILVPVGIYGFLGNSLLLSRYLKHYPEAPHVDELKRKMAAAYWAPMVAIILMLAPPFIDEIMIITGYKEGTAISGIVDEAFGSSSTASSMLDDGNSKYAVKYNADGAILTSDSDTLYLGNSCDAASNKWGKGKWRAANAGLMVDFEGKTLGFHQQQLQLECSERSLVDDKSRPTPTAMFIVDGRCHMDGCGWIAVQSIQNIKENSSGKLVEISNVYGSSSHLNGEYPDKFSDKLDIEWNDSTSKSYVFCSKSFPSIFSYDDFEWQTSVFSFDNIYGAQESSANIYVRVCHNLPSGAWGRDNFMSKFGYLPMENELEVTLSTPSDIFNYTR